GGGTPPATPTTYTITFKADGYTGVTGLPSSLTVTQGAAAARPADPALAGQSFVGWYREAAFTTLYNWTAPVTANLTLYARFEDTLAAATLALDFASIRGANTHEQGIGENLTTLPTSLPNYPGVEVSWRSSQPGVISATGAVTRPGEAGADAEVTLTATLALGDKTETKTFDLIVRKQGIAEVTLEGVDPRFAPGYPKVVFGGSQDLSRPNRAVLKIKLNPGVATAAQPMIAYFVADRWGAKGDTALNKESILYGHINRTGVPIDWADVVDDLPIYNDEEYSVLLSNDLLLNGFVTTVGVVLLADGNFEDAIEDSAAVATVFSAVTDGANDDDFDYLGTLPLESAGAVFNTAGNKIFLYFSKKVGNPSDALPPVSDFEISLLGDELDAEITKLEIAHDPNLGADDRQASWLILTLRHPIDAADQGIVHVAYANSGESPICDMDARSLDSIIWDSVTPGTQTLSAYISPASGTISLAFTPALQMPAEDPQGFLDRLVPSLSYNGNPITLSECVENQWFVDRCELLFTFDPIPGAALTEDAFTAAIASDVPNLISTAFEPFSALGATIAPILSSENTEEVEAIFSAVRADGFGPGTLILVTLPSGTNIQGTFANASVSMRSFILKADGERVLYRGRSSSTRLPRQFALPPLSGRLAERLSRATSVTIEYDPVASGYGPDDPCVNLYDRNGVPISEFGPIPVGFAGIGTGTLATYTVRFDAPYSGVTNLPSARTVKRHAVASRPADPVLAGHTFVGWYFSDTFATPYDWTWSVPRDLTLYAKFEAIS
ncbi:MAG: InlB B-repeat-containing protein, partial [Oscillospiraceae bacterium]|nr:InlB B-repeat-containing protein [Oscillospiraceae bacterium]